MDKQLLVLGVGNMGAAIVRGILEKKSLPDWTITLIDPFKPSREPFERYEQVESFEKVSDLASSYKADYLLLAIKPQFSKDTLPTLLPILKADSCIVSIMAGRSVNSIKNDLGADYPTVRIMPNLPILVGRGVSLFYAEDKVSDELKEKATLLFSHSSTVLEVSKEELIDAGTAISGSGPGFVFHLLQGAYSKALELGFTEDQAKNLVSETVQGSTELYSSSIESLETLEKRVTSIGGTTEAGIKALSVGDTKTLISKAITAAFERAQQLAD